jgi:hypothetical protein
VACLRNAKNGVSFNVLIISYLRELLAFRVSSTKMDAKIGLFCFEKYLQSMVRSIVANDAFRVCVAASALVPFQPPYAERCA